MINMNIRYSEKVENHNHNHSYKVVIVEFHEQDNNIRYYPEHKLFDWIPTDEEVIRLCKIMIDVSPSFRRYLEGLFLPLGGFI